MILKILRYAIIINSLSFITGYCQSTKTFTLNLNTAIDLALKNNENVLIASNDVRSANALLREAWADAFPDIMLNGIYTRNFKQPVFFFPDPLTGEQTAFRIGSKNSYVATLSIDQPLFQAGKISGGIKAARLFKKFSSEGFQTVKADMILAVKKAYYTVQLDEQLLEINQQSLDQQLANLDNTRKLFNQGQVSELDTLRAWVNYTNLQPVVISMENNLRIAENQLKELIGIDLDQEISLKDELAYEQTNGISMSEMQDYAFKSRPELRRLELQVDMLKHNIGITRSDLLPKLYLNSTYQSVAQSDAFDFGVGFQSSFSSALRLEIPIFKGFRTRAKIQQAKIDYQNSKYLLEQYKDNLRIEVKSIILKIKEAEKRVQVQRHAIHQAERALFMSERRYKEGVGTQLELGDSLLALNITKSNYVQAVYDHKIALADLNKAIGRD